MSTKVGQWKQRSRLYEKDLEKDSYFKEVLVEDTRDESRNYRRPSFFLEDEQSSTGISSDGEVNLEKEKEHQKPKLPHRIPLNQRNVVRIKRNVAQKLILAIKSVISILLSFPILLFFVTMATYTTGKQHLLDKKKRIQDADETDIPDEMLTQDETYYAERWGYTSEMHEVVTQDGYILKMYRIYKKGSTPKGKPVLIGHGLFQCSGAFVLNEQRSLAFALIESGYDVWVGNNRSIAGLDHISLSFKDPEYWNWGLKELGIYDFAAMINHVKLYSNSSSKVAYIGHSQGNAQAFIALSLSPEIADSLSCFVALAPAVFSGNLVNTFPLNRLINLSDWCYNLMFGSGSFLPIMSFAQTIVEPKLFCFLAYSMFSYLFSWWDSHWLRRRKAKYFQFTPRPVSSRLIADWIAGWGRKGVCLYVADQNTVMNAEIKQKVPLVVFYGTADFLVNGERFVRTFPGYGTHGLSPEQLAKESSQTTTDCQKTLFPMLDLVHVERLDGYEHMDTIWGHDNHKTTYPIVLKNLENARWD